MQRLTFGTQYSAPQIALLAQTSDHPHGQRVQVLGRDFPPFDGDQSVPVPHALVHPFVLVFAAQSEKTAHVVVVEEKSPRLAPNDRGEYEA